jgi:lysophospholipase L1-like esterase
MSGDKTSANAFKLRSRFRKHGISVPIAFVLMMILLVGIVVEAGARLIFNFKEQIVAWAGIGLELDVYEMPDPRHPGNWVLKPGFSQTLEQAVKAKKKSGRVLGANYLEVSRPQTQEEEVILQINQDGFRGSEIDKTHSRLRILTIGDSCTFGLLGVKPYPGVLEYELHRMGSDVEVVNGGVEGYSPRNVLLRIEDFKTLKPEITTVYVGWNALYSENEITEGLERYLYSLKIIRITYPRLLRATMSPQEAALRAYNKAKRPDPNALTVKSLEGYVPSFMKDVEQIINEMQSVGSKVVLVTLPGLYIMEEEPSDLALKMGHLPTFTDNPYVLAKMSERYNVALRKLAKQYTLQVIDLEKWSKTALRPRDKYFFDAVHLHKKGQEMIGVYMAIELHSLLQQHE